MGVLYLGRPHGGIHNMNIKSTEKKENSTVELVIEVEAAEFEAALNKVYAKQRKNIALPGFRKGKAPRKMIEAMYGPQVFYEDAIEEAYPDAYAAALKEAGIEPVAYPQLEVQEVGKEGVTFKAVVTVAPEVKLKKYKGMTAPKSEVKVTDEDIEQELKPYINRAARLVTVERPAANGDTVVIDFKGLKDGVPFEGGTAENYSLELGSGAFVPGFEEQLVGAKAGDEKALDITFPEEYTPELAGAAVVFEVKVHEVKERQVPTVDDEFAKDVSEFETLADFKKDLGEKLAARRQEQADREFENALIEKLADGMEAEIPQDMIDYQTDRLVEEYAMRIQSQGIKFEDYLKMLNMSVDDVRAQAKEQAERRVRTDLALDAVIKAEGLEVSEEELDAEINRLAEENSMEAEAVRKVAPLDEIRKGMLNKKAVELIVSSAKVSKAGTRKSTKKAADKAEEPEKSEEAGEAKE